MKRFLLLPSLLLLESLACGNPQFIPPTPEYSVFDSGKTAYGFFPSPPEATLESILRLFKDMSAHGDFVLIQRNTAWEDFGSGTDGESQTRTDLINQVNTLLNDFNLDSYAERMKKDGRNPQDVVSLGAFANIGLRDFDGSPKPTLEVWDEMRKR